jgi:hypothetical protein
MVAPAKVKRVGRPKGTGPNKKTQYPIPEELLSAVPDDFDAKVHKPLKRANFAKESVYYTLQAERCEQMVIKLTKRGVLFRRQSKILSQFANKEEQQKAQTMLRMQDKMASLREELENAGIDVSLLDAMKDGDTDTDEEN